VGRRGQERTHPRPGEKHRRRRNGGGAARGAVHLLPSLEKTTGGRKGLSPRYHYWEDWDGTGEEEQGDSQCQPARRRRSYKGRMPLERRGREARTTQIPAVSCVHVVVRPRGHDSQIVPADDLEIRAAWTPDFRWQVFILRKITRRSKSTKKSRLIQDSNLSGQSFTDASELLRTITLICQVWYLISTKTDEKIFGLTLEKLPLYLTYKTLNILYLSHLSLFSLFDTSIVEPLYPENCTFSLDWCCQSVLNVLFFLSFSFIVSFQFIFFCFN
jgi:hypothetical protein